MNFYKEKKLTKGNTVNPALNGKYDNDPFFKSKLEKASDFLKKAGLPKVVEEHLKKHNHQ